MSAVRSGRRKQPHPLRVAHLDHTSAPGGAQLALARMLSEHDSWQAVLLVPPSGRGGAFADLVGCVPVHVGGISQPPGVSSSAWTSVIGAAARLAIQAAATRMDRGFRTADIVDANTARSAAYGAIAARTSSVPFVIHLRDFVDADSLGRFGRLAMSRLALPRADGVVANSRATLESAKPFLRADALTAVIPSASGLGRVPAAQRRRSSGQPLRVGMLARIDPWKGQVLLLEAFAAAFGDGDERLEFAGSALFGHDRFVAELRARADELGLGDRVEFLGQVDDIEPLLHRWDIGVQSSLRPEPLGQNVLQYLAAGLPSIVADEGGPAEWIENGRNGIRVAPRDRVALTDALRQLAGDGAMRARIATAAARTPGLLTDAEVVEAHGEFYRKILRRRS